MPPANFVRGDEPIAISLIGDGDVALAGPDGNAVQLKLPDLKGVLENHPTITLITADAVELHRAMAAAFARDQGSVGLLWDLSASGRLIDVVRLDQRIRTARQGVHAKRHQLADISQSLDAGWDRPVEPLESLSLLHRVHDELAHRADDTQPNEPTKAKRHRLLGHDHDVRAALALDAVAQIGLQLAPDKAQQLRDAADRAIHSCSKQIGTDVGFRQGFDWTKSRAIRRDQDGRIGQNSNRLRNCLQLISERLVDFCDTPRRLPLDDAENVSIIPAHWSRWWDPSIAAWLDLYAAAAVLRTIQDGLIVHPHYGEIPQITPQGAGCGEFHRLTAKPFQARQGQRLVVISLPDLALRCFSQVANARVLPGICVAGLYNRFEDPVQEIAKHLWATCKDSVSRGLPEGDNVQGQNRIKWLIITRLIIRSVAEGQSERETSWCWREQLPEFPADSAAIAGLKAAVFQGWPEFRYYLNENLILKAAAQREGSDGLVVLNKYGSERGPETAGGAARRRYTRNGRLDELLVSPNSGSGRKGIPTYPTQVPCAEAGQLEDDVRVAILFALVRGGWPVVGFDGDDFVVELPRNRAEDKQVVNELTAVCNRAAFELTGDKAFRCCTCAIRDRW